MNSSSEACDYGYQVLDKLLFLYLLSVDGFYSAIIGVEESIQIPKPEPRKPVFMGYEAPLPPPGSSTISTALSLKNYRDFK